MMKEGGFVAPLSSDFGWHLNHMVYKLAAQHDTAANLNLYRDHGNVFKFDSWVQVPKSQSFNAAQGPVTGKSGARAPDDSVAAPAKPKTTPTPRPKTKPKKTVSIREESDSSGSEATRTINEDEYERPQWRVVGKGKKANTREQAAVKDQIRSSFGRLIPNWP